MHDESIFELKSVIQAARDEAQLDDFGDTAFEEPLKRFLESAQNGFTFTQAGSQGFALTVRRWLVNRLRLVQAQKANKAIADEDVSDPIIILGMPRTGTTKFQRFLSQSPQAISLPLWMTLNPCPFPGERPGNPVKRIEFAKAVQAAQAEDNPEFLASHERTAEEAEEDSDLLLMALDYPMVQILCPRDFGYLDWLRSRSRLPAYELQRDFLRYLQWQQGGKQGRHWVLKNPGHIGQMDALIATYPNATIIHTHRNLLEVLPSYCRLMQSIYDEMFIDVEPDWIGRHAIKFWGPEFKRQAKQREQLADRLKIIDASYLDVVKQPMMLAEDIYRLAGFELTCHARESMLRWDSSNAQHSHGKPSYSLEEFGITEEVIVEAFGSLDV